MIALPDRDKNEGIHDSKRQIVQMKMVHESNVIYHHFNLFGDANENSPLVRSPVKMKYEEFPDCLAEPTF